MTYFIYKHRLTGEQRAVEAESIAEDQEVLFDGNKEDFEALGFNENQIGGLEKQNGQLVFSMGKKEQAESLKKPIASGANMIAYVKKALLEGKINTFTDDQRADLVFAIQSIIGVMAQVENFSVDKYQAYMESAIKNTNIITSTQADKVIAKGGIKKKPNNGKVYPAQGLLTDVQFDTLLTILDEWKQTVRFVDAKQ